MPAEQVLLAAPRGFCAGVEMAIKALTWMVRLFDPPVYCYHEIVHNKAVVDRFRAQGVVFVDDIVEVPSGAPVMLSAHGSAPEVVAAATAAGGVVVDAVCPLVTKVHHEVKSRAGKGYEIIYVGHHGHDEAVGTMAVAPDAVRLVETVADVEQLAATKTAESGTRLDPTPRAFLAQTTLSLDEWRAVLEAAQQQFPDLWTPGRSDLCFATTNRQSAVRAIAPQVDALVVVGSANSSNTVALAKVATAHGCPRVLRINAVEELSGDLTGRVGVTAGASAPDELVQAIVAALAPTDGVELVTTVEEDEYFPPPRGLRQVVDPIAAAVTCALGAPEQSGPLAADRQATADAALVSLGTLSVPP